ncbi:hypothetical protein F0562_034020 [Nyssa sinensis]|uniref:Uncharacterized protein n=1 Tax=Nyssa sinensis TaxID=561372 RepID=A0A5J5AJ51_9ASTE|nr:hypothetical protein F0562_034020 [Nyssa sinensis]
MFHRQSASLADPQIHGLAFPFEFQQRRENSEKTGPNQRQPRWMKKTRSQTPPERLSLPLPDAFEELSQLVKSTGSDDLCLKPFCDASSLVSVLFGYLGIAFKFAELEYVSKLLLFKRSSFNSLCTGLCTISHMGSQDSSFCWNVCPSDKGTASAEAK